MAMSVHRKPQTWLVDMTPHRILDVPHVGSSKIHTHIYIYIYVFVCIHLYIYIHNICIYIYIYVYIYIYAHIRGTLQHRLQSFARLRRWREDLLTLQRRDLHRYLPRDPTGGGWVRRSVGRCQARRVELLRFFSEFPP